MLHKRTSHRDCISNYSQSFSNLHNNPLIGFELKELCLKKSLFNPPEGLVQSYASRRHITQADVPNIEVIHSSKRWLLIQAPRFSRSFFKRLNSAQLGNPYQQLLKVFKSFAVLTSIYGFFRPTAGMIFMERRTIRVWINEDVFSITPMYPLNLGQEGQREFVLAFLGMLERQMNQWEQVNGIQTIEETIKMLDERSKIKPNKPTTFFDVQELEDHKRLSGYRSVQNLKFNQEQDHCPSVIDSSVTVKDEGHPLFSKISNQKKISGLFSEGRDLKNSFSDMKGVEIGNQVRRTKKMNNLTSTSTTLKKFCEGWRATVGKKAKKVIQPPESNQDEQYQPQTAHLHHHNSEPLNIQHEFQGLFNEDEPRELKLGIEGDRQQLQKIAEQIQEVLIW